MQENDVVLEEARQKLILNLKRLIDKKTKQADLATKINEISLNHKKIPFNLSKKDISFMIANKRTFERSQKDLEILIEITDNLVKEAAENKIQYFIDKFFYLYYRRDEGIGRGVLKIFKTQLGSIEAHIQTTNDILDYTSKNISIFQNDYLEMELYADTNPPQKKLSLRFFIGSTRVPDICIGVGTNLTGVGIMASTTVLELQSDENRENLSPKYYKFDENCEGLDKNILMYLYEKKMNMLKVPETVTNKESFESFHTKQIKKTGGSTKKYDKLKLFSGIFRLYVRTLTNKIYCSILKISNHTERCFRYELQLEADKKSKFSENYITESPNLINNFLHLNFQKSEDEIHIIVELSAFVEDAEILFASVMAVTDDERKVGFYKAILLKCKSENELEPKHEIIIQDFLNKTENVNMSLHTPIDNDFLFKVENLKNDKFKI